MAADIFSFIQPLMALSRSGIFRPETASAEDPARAVRETWQPA